MERLMRKTLVRIMGILFVGILLVHVVFKITTGSQFWHFPAFLIGVAGVCLLSGKNTGRLLASLVCLSYASLCLIFILAVVFMSPELLEPATKRLVGILAALAVVFGVFYAFLVAPGTRGLYQSERKLVNGKRMAKPALFAAGLTASAIAAVFLYVWLSIELPRGGSSLGLGVFARASTIFAVVGIVCFGIWYRLGRADSGKNASDSDTDASLSTNTGDRHS